MSTEITALRDKLVAALKRHEASFKITADTPEKFEVTGTIEAMQGKKKVDGIYFASLVPKPKDVRLYFFPTYTHAAEMQDMPENLKKCLKGKSCFHIKKLDAELENDIRAMIDKGVGLYQRDGLLK